MGDDGAAAYKRGDYVEALKLLLPRASQGDAEAQNQLGVIYEAGKGVPQDYAEALKWFKLAAARGFRFAQINLGVKYEHGTGVPQDYVLAHMWFNLATSLSDDSLIVRVRDELAKKMTPQQVAEAQRLARECQQRNFKDCG